MSKLIDKIDAVLPQTQCQLCDYPGCRPYAEAISKGERIDKCLPGGVHVLEQLGQLTATDITPYVANMQRQQKPAMLAIIREEECIGCTKCIQACPVDAIVGASKLMHTVISDACNGCELCVPPCPVDCIDMITLPPRDTTSNDKLAQQSRQRYQHHQQRLQQQQRRKRQSYESNKLGQRLDSLDARKAAIEEAIARAKQKRGQHE